MESSFSPPDTWRKEAIAAEMAADIAHGNMKTFRSHCVTIYSQKDWPGVKTMLSILKGIALLMTQLLPALPHSINV